MFKKILSAVLSLVILFSCLSVTGAKVNAAASETTIETLNRLATKFPHGKYWNHVGGENNPDKVTNTPCANHSRCDWQVNACDCNSFDNSIQCMGYAHKIAYEIVGSSPRHTFTKSTTLDVSKLRVGDIIRYRWNGHSLCVTGVKGTKISFTDCNWIGKCQIRWDVMDISVIKNMGFSYVLHHEDNNRKNTDLYFFQNVEQEQQVDLEEAAHEVWKMSELNNLYIRATHSTSSNIVGQIGKGTTFKVYDKYFDGTYVWGKILVDDIIGWSALNYSEYIKGSLEKPEIKGKTSCFVAAKSFTLKWNEVPGAESYTVYIYNENKKVVKQYTVSGLSKSIKIYTPGKYYAKIKATNSITPSWKSVSKEISFSVVDEIVKVSSLSLSKTSLSLEKGKTYTLKATVKPSDAADKSVTYSSSNKSVATVSSSGTITAKSFGTATITCTAKDTGKVTAKCTVKVIPSQVKGIKQSASSTGTGSIKWDKVSGASKYIIYKYNKSTEKYEKYDTVTTNSYKFSFTANKSIKIKIYAVGYSGSVSYKSKVSDPFTVYSGTKAPTLKVTAGTKSAKLSWNKVSGATGYIVYMYKNGKAEKLKVIYDSDITSFTKKGLSSGKTYSFRVRAIKKSVTPTIYSSYSSKVSVKVK